MNQTSPAISDLQLITQQLYQKNLDLVNANKELALTQKLYEIMSRDLTVNTVAQECINTLVKELGFVAGLVILKDPTGQYLQAIAVSQSRRTRQAVEMLEKPLKSHFVSIHHRKNLLAKSYRTQTKLTTTRLDKVFSPILTPVLSQQIQQVIRIKTTLIFPLILGQKKLGLFTLSLHRDARNLTVSEKRILRRIVPIFAVALDRVMLYQDLKAANEKLRQLDELKDEFLSIAGHELRTPMTAIKSYLWMILNKKRPEDTISAKTHGYLDRAYFSTERLIDLVNDMLDVSRIESGRIEFNPEVFDIQQLTAEVKEELAAKALENQLQIIVNQNKNLPQINADKNKIHQVLLNLIGNALKFTPQGGSITVTFALKNHHFETAIADTGKGIAKENLSKLFTKFGRLEGDLTAIAATKGTGLGLYICKQYIEKQGGQIWVDSELDKGTTFTFTLPVST